MINCHVYRSFFVICIRIKLKILDVTKHLMNKIARQLHRIAHPGYKKVKELNILEYKKQSSRTEIINFILNKFDRETCYLEIGVRNPNHNYAHIKSNKKYSVDPGKEFKTNPVDFKITSDEFFAQLRAGKVLSPDIKFDVVFIDGLHLAEQVDRDIINALDFIKEDGFVVLHDCSPASEWHAREDHNFLETPAFGIWNGTTWKAFQKWRFEPGVYSCCIDCDWGVGVLSKKRNIGNSIQPVNPFYEFEVMNKNRKAYLNLVDFETFKKFF